jgi:hypothetical protein
MGKFTDSITPQEGAQVSPDPVPHDKVEKPKSTASQGVRTTQTGTPPAEKK